MTLARKHLQVVPTHARGQAPEKSALERVFDHWVWMMGKNPRRTVLGPTRKKAIAKWLDLYGEETLQLAIERCAASAWHAGDNDRGTEYNDLELILRDEAHIERFAAAGEALRERAARADQRAAVVQPLVVEPEPDPAELAAKRERLRAMAARMAGRKVAHD